MHINRNLLFSFIASTIWLPIWAQPKFSTIVNEKEIGKNDYLQVEYVVENAKSVEQLAAPDFKGFIVASGPMSQSGMSIVNGVVSKYEGVSYILKPTGIGKATVPGATAMVDGKAMHSNSVGITVTNSASINPNVNNPGFGLSLPEELPEVNEEYILRKGEKAADKIKNNLLVKLEVNKTSCYIGEPVVATYKLCSRLKSESSITKRPTLSQFSVYDMVQPETNIPTTEKINGKLFNVHIIRKVQLYPLQEGSFVLDPVTLDNRIRFFRQESGTSKPSMQQLLDEYANGLMEGKPEEQHVEISSKPVTITVKALPANGKPNAFDGAVGKFSIAALLPDTAITANETTVLKVVLKGEGNIPLINAPVVHWPDGIEGEEPSVKETTDKTVAPINGEKIFEYHFTVKRKGRFVIPAIECSFFEPSSGTYKTISTDSLTAMVTRASNKRMSDGTIKDKQVAENNSPLKKLFWILPVLALVWIWLLFRKKQTKQPVRPTASLPEIVPEKLVTMQDPFESSKAALNQGNSQAFYKELGNATWNYLSEKLAIKSSQQNKPMVTAILERKAVSATTIALLESVLKDCEMALYTPVHSENDMLQTLNAAETLVKDLNAVL